MGSLPERQEFFRSVAKPQDSFQDRASALLMAGRGWTAVIPQNRKEPPALRLAAFYYTLSRI
jgi:hypothetical protein